MSLPCTHEQAQDHSILSLGLSLSDYCIKGENVVQHILEKAEDGDDTSH